MNIQLSKTNIYMKKGITCNKKKEQKNKRKN